MNNEQEQLVDLIVKCTNTPYDKDTSIGEYWIVNDYNRRLLDTFHKMYWEKSDYYHVLRALFHGLGLDKSLIEFINKKL
jgi:hypothetical protein